MSSFDLTKNIRITNPVSSVDYYYGIYDSFQEALDNVPLEIRRAGRTVGIKTGNVVSEYWWNDETDLSDTGLVIKNSAGGGVPEAPTDGNIYGRKNALWEVVEPTNWGSEEW